MQNCRAHNNVPAARTCQRRPGVAVSGRRHIFVAEIEVNTTYPQKNNTAAKVRSFAAGTANELYSIFLFAPKFQHLT